MNFEKWFREYSSRVPMLGTVGEKQALQSAFAAGFLAGKGIENQTVEFAVKNQGIELVVRWQGQDYGIKLGQPVRYLGADDGKGGVRTAERSGQVGVVDEVLIARDNRSGRCAGVTITIEFPDGDLRRILAHLHQIDFNIGENGQRVQRKPEGHKTVTLEDKAARHPGSITFTE